MYSYGNKAFHDLNDPNAEILYDVSVFIRGFDLMTKTSFLKIDVSKTIYQFDKADIIIGSTSIILLGKSKQFGSVSYASPVEIITGKKLTSISTALLINWTELNGRIVIEIKDEFYSKPFKLAFKDNNENIKPWLIKVLPAIN